MSTLKTINVQHPSAASPNISLDSSGNVGVGTASPSVPLQVTTTTATTNAVTQALRIDSQSSGTPANGIGVGIQFATETAAGNTEVGATIEAITTDVTATSEDFDLSFKTMAAGAAAAERMRLTSAGDLQFNSGYGSVATAYGCRAWVNFDGTQTAANMIRASGNVSSMTDNGTGDYTVNFTTAMPDANYCAQVSQGQGAGAGVGMSVITGAAPSTSAVRIQTANSAGTLADRSYVMVAIFR